MKTKRAASLLLAALLLLTGLTACGEEKKDNEITANAENGSIEEAKAALNAGEYEKAYQMLSNNQSPEAKKLLNKLVYVPILYEWKESDETCKWQYSYDEKGNLLSTKETENGNVYEEVYEYDANGNLCSSTHISKGEVTDTTTYTCDTMGRVISKGSSTYTYDAEGNLLSETRDYGEGHIQSITYTYDAYGNRISYTYDNGEEKDITTYTYDEKGRLVAESSDSSYINHDITYTYDAQGRLIKKVDLATAIDSAIEFTTQTTTYEYTYVENGDATTVTEKRDGKDRTPITYTQDKFGNYLTMTREEETCTFTWKLFYYPNGVPHTVKEIVAEIEKDTSIY